MTSLIRASRHSYKSILSGRRHRTPHMFVHRSLQHLLGPYHHVNTPPSSLGFVTQNNNYHDMIKPPHFLLSNQKIPFSSSASAKVDAKETLEETYSRKTPLEHILLRPSMYIGPTERLPPVSSWVLSDDTSTSSSSSSQWKMHREELPSVPALLKVFDEILVNASDNRLRHPRSCNRIDVTIHRGDASSKPYISISNNGKSIPVQIHKKEKMYIPELLFGHLLTGSNFNDDQKRLTGGRHGYGAKLTNVFSKKFVVEVRDGHSTKGKCKTYKQVWEDNMHTCHEAEVTVEAKQQGGKDDNDMDFVKISFVPDLTRLTNDPKVKILPEEEYKMMRRRVVDIAGCSGGKLTVTLDGEEIAVKGFADYVKFYRQPQEPPLVYNKLNTRWEVAIGLSETKALESISFVNGMNTSRGGTHIDVLAKQISEYIAAHINKKMAKQLDPTLNVTPRMVRRHLMICVNALIENPSFDSQMKECLTSNPRNFGSDYELSTSFLRKLVQPALVPDDDDDLDGSAEGKSGKAGGPGIVEEVLRMAMGAQQINMVKLLKGVGASDKESKRKVLTIPKLEDANLAGSKSSGDCALILTEGDSAKALAVAGLEVIGRDRYGVFPLRGKFLNVRNVTVNQLANNAELKALCSIIGLQFGKEYKTRNERQKLRYGHVMLMTDQDDDGSHIKGLMINLFRHFWPALLKPPVGKREISDAGEDRPFLSMFVTPLLKASTKDRKKVSISFFSMAEYDTWRQSLGDDEIHTWNVKYYKGLGTSTPAEAKEYFIDFLQHYRPFRWQSEENDGGRIDMAFEKERSDDRKDWILEKYDKTSTVSVDESDGNSITYGDFVDNELIHYSNANNIRSLPNAIDGLKPSQRKVLHACFKRNLKDEIKVAQLAGYCAEHTAYHHGEASLHATIVGMAQDFVGSNNVSLLVPSGQFGTRLMGGSDAASPRYIFTHLSPIARLLFPESDDMLLTYKEDEGQMIEPEFFCPVIPLLLVNGCQGIGTGWSTFIPQHNPRDVLNYIRAKIEGKKRLPAITPWVRDFKGDIIIDAKRGSYITEGIITPMSKSSLAISELPIGVWTTDYKEKLVNMLNRGDIKSFSENHTTTSVSFGVEVDPDKLQKFLKGDIHKTFKIRNSLSTRNMHAFNDMTIAKYASPREIADVFFPIRLGLYEDRKSVLECNMEYSAKLMRSKSRFIEAVSNAEIDLLQKSKEATHDLLEGMGFWKHSDLVAMKMNANPSDVDVDSKLNFEEFDYLLNMSLSSLTHEKIKVLNDEASKTETKLATIKNTSAADLWIEDLDRLEPHL